MVGVVPLVTVGGVLIDVEFVVGGVEVDVVG